MTSTADGQVIWELLHIKVQSNYQNYDVTHHALIATQLFLQIWYLNVGAQDMLSQDILYNFG